jgi:hypothetical protein
MVQEDHNPYRSNSCVDSHRMRDTAYKLVIPLSHLITITAIHFVALLFLIFFSSTFVIWIVLLGPFAASVSLNLLKSHSRCTRMRNLLLVFCAPYILSTFLYSVHLFYTEIQLLRKPESIYPILFFTLGFFAPILGIGGYSCSMRARIQRSPAQTAGLWFATISSLVIFLGSPLLPQESRELSHFVIALVSIAFMVYSWLAFDASPFLASTVFCVSSISMIGVVNNWPHS